MASPVSVSELVTAMMALKNMYDQHQDNKQEVKVLQDFIAEYSEHVPSIQQALKERKSTGVAVTVLHRLESVLEEATQQLNKWAADRNFFRLLKSTDRKGKLEKLARHVMSSVQNNMHIAVISLLVCNLPETQSHGSSSDITPLDSVEEVKSALTTQIGRMDCDAALRAKDEALKARQEPHVDSKFWEDILAAITSREESLTKYSDDFMDPILHTLMIDPVVATNGHTYCRWTIIDNNMIRDPHDLSKDLMIMVDNVNLRSGLFDKFPEQTDKYRQRRHEYRCKALSLARSNQLADAVVALQHVLKWNENDEECALALDEVKETMKNPDIQHSHDMPNPSPSNGDQRLSPVGGEMNKKNTLETPDRWVQDEVKLPDISEGDDKVEDGADGGSTHPSTHTAENDELKPSTAEEEDAHAETDGSSLSVAENCETNLYIPPIRGGLKLTLKRRWFRGHSKKITSVHWSPGGDEIVSASEDKTVIIWEIKYRPSHEKPSGCLPSLRWQSDAKTKKCRQKSAGQKHNLSGRVKMTLNGHSGPVNCVAYDVSGRWIASASSDNSAKIWNARTGCVLHTLRSHSDDVTCVAWSSDGSLATTSADCTTIIWERKSGNKLCTLKGHTKEVTCAAWSPTGNRLATTSKDNSIIVWDIQGKHSMRLKALIGHTAAVTSVAWSGDGGTLVTCSRDMSIRIWVVEPLKCTVSVSYSCWHSEWINAVSWSPITNLIATASDDARTSILAGVQQSKTKRKSSFETHTRPATSVAWCPRGKYLVTGSSDKTLKILFVGNATDFEIEAYHYLKLQSESCCCSIIDVVFHLLFCKCFK